MTLQYMHSETNSIEAQKLRETKTLVFSPLSRSERLDGQIDFSDLDLLDQLHRL